MTKTANDAEARILPLIGHGEENAVPLYTLTRLSSLPSRRLRKNLETLRRSGHLIVSSENGYFFPETKKELCDYINKEEKRARSIFFTLKTARMTLKRVQSEEGAQGDKHSLSVTDGGKS